MNIVYTLFLIAEKANLRRMERPNSVVGSNLSSTSPNNNSEVNPILVAGETTKKLLLFLVLTVILLLV